MPTSTLGYALLGLLARESLTGYDLAQLLREPISFYWSARHSQIYPELARLERDGLVRHKLVRQTERPDKKVFTVTPRGRRSLRVWATAPAGPRQSRDELLLKTFAIWTADPAQAAELYRGELAKHAAMRKRHEAALALFEGRLGARPRLDDRDFGDYATLRRGVGYERELVAWLRWMIETITARRSPVPARSRTRSRTARSR